MCFSQALPCWNVQFSSGGPLLVGTCENSKFATNMSFNNWLIQRLHFFKLSSAIAFFAYFVNLKKAGDYPWSYCSTLSIVLHHKSYLFFFFSRWGRGSYYTNDFLIFVAITYYYLGNTFLDTVVQVITLNTYALCTTRQHRLMIQSWTLHKQRHSLVPGFVQPDGMHRTLSGLW